MTVTIVITISFFFFIFSTTTTAKHRSNKWNFDEDTLCLRQYRERRIEPRGAILRQRTASADFSAPPTDGQRQRRDDNAHNPLPHGQGYRRHEFPSELNDEDLSDANRENDVEHDDGVFEDG